MRGGNEWKGGRGGGKEEKSLHLKQSVCYISIHKVLVYLYHCV